MSVKAGVLEPCRHAAIRRNHPQNIYPCRWYYPLGCAHGRHDHAPGVTVHRAIKVRGPDPDRFIRRVLAVGLYREASVARAGGRGRRGRRAGREMILLLDERGVPVDDSGEILHPVIWIE